MKKKVLGFILATVITFIPLTNVYATSNVPTKIDPSSILPVAGVSSIEFPTMKGEVIEQNEGLKILNEVNSKMENLDSLESTILYDMVFLGSTNSMFGYSIIHPKKNEALLNLNVRGKETESYYINNLVFQQDDYGDWKNRTSNIKNEISLQYVLDLSSLNKLQLIKNENGDYIIGSIDYLPIDEVLKIVPNGKTLLPKNTIAEGKSLGRVSIIINKEMLITDLFLELNKESEIPNDKFRIILHNKFSKFNSANEISYPNEVKELLNTSNTYNSSNTSNTSNTSNISNN